MDEQPEPVSRWQNPFWTQVRATIVGGLAVLVIAGVFGVVATKVTKLSARHALLYIGLPALVLVLLVVGFFVGRAAVRTARAWSAWQASVSEYVVQMSKELRRLHLTEVIETAEALGWVVYDDEDHDLMFVSPSGEPFYVRDTAPNPEHVAGALYEIDPMAFPEEWTSSSGQVGEVANQVAGLSERLDQLAETLPRALVAATIATVEAEARASGWTAHWADDHVTFIHAKRGETATVMFDNIDLVTLRKAMRLNEAFKDW